MNTKELLKILSTKGNGQFIKIHLITNLDNKQGAKSKKNGDIIEKDTIATVRKGIEYKNIKTVREALIAKEQYREDPKTGKIEVIPKSLPWGNWVNGYEGLLIENKGEIYVRLYSTPNKPISKFILNGKEVSKDELKESGVMQNAYWNNNNNTHNECMTVKVSSIKEIW